MVGSINAISNPRLNLNVLSREDVERIHGATLDVIERSGVRFPSRKALDVWEAHGATVDRETMIVRAPGHVIEDALAQCPPAYTLAAREPAQDLPLDGNHVYVGTDGCGVAVIDLDSGMRRPSRLQDVADIARVADGIEEVGFHWVAVSAQDRPPETRGLYELQSGRAEVEERPCSTEGLLARERVLHSCGWRQLRLPNGARPAELWNIMRPHAAMTYRSRHRRI